MKFSNSMIVGGGWTVASEFLWPDISLNGGQRSQNTSTSRQNVITKE